MMDDKRSVRRIKSLHYVLFALIVITVIICIVIYKYNYTFSSSRWIQFPDERTKMVSDMLEKNDLTGKTREEIKDLLGDETKTGYFKSNDNCVYYLGAERGLFSIDSEWLVITFANNKVVSTEILTD